MRSEPSGTGTAASANVPQRHFKSPPATVNGACGSVSRVDHSHHKQDQEAPPQQPTVVALGTLGNEVSCLELTQEGADVGSSISISAPAELQSKVSATSSTLLPGCDQEVLNSVKPSMDTQPCAVKDIESDRIDPPPLQDTLGSHQVEVSSKDKTPGTCGGHQKSNTSSLPDESGNPKEAGINMGDPLQVPSSFFRSNYASRSFSELKEFVVNQRRKQNGDHDDPQGMEVESQRSAKEGHIFSLKYNVQTFSALANWALLPVPMTTSDNKKQNLAKCQKIEMRNKLDAQHRDRILLPPAPFRKCTICGKFGHIEAECDMLFNAPESSHSAPVPFGQPRSVAGVTDVHSAQKRTALGVGTATPCSPDVNIMPASNQLVSSAIAVSKNEERKDTVLNLSRELSIQSKQLQLISADYKNKKRKRSSKDDKDRLLLDSFVEDEFQSQVCKTCGCGFGDADMIVCDGCESLLHLSCLDPPLKRVPAGKWFCDDCLKCDSETSSMVELEGCGDFFIEQRKMSKAKELWRKAHLHTDTTLGYSKGADCESAIAVVNEIEPEKSPYMRQHINRKHKSDGTGGFFVSEICWARYNQSWFPGMVREYQTREYQTQATKSSGAMAMFTVTLFGADEDVGVSLTAKETSILPFLPYYESLGFKQLSRSNGNFHFALKQAVVALGLKTIGQCLKLAREGIQMTLDVNNHQRKSLPSTLQVPSGWENSDMDKIDDEFILARSSGDSLLPMSPRGINHCGGVVHESEAKKVVASFSDSELVGSIVSWLISSSQVRYGLVLFIDAAKEEALVRFIPELSSGNQDALLKGEQGEMNTIYVTSKSGSALRLPLKQVRFVAGKPSVDEMLNSHRRLKKRMRIARKEYAEQNKKNAWRRESRMVELGSSAMP